MKKILSILSVLIVKILFLVLTIMPRAAITPISILLGQLFYSLKLKKKVIKRNWLFIFNKEITNKELKKIYTNTTRNFVETLYLFTSDSKKVLNFVNYTETEKAVRDNVNDNAVFITMHYANWEVVGCYLAIKYTAFYPIYKKISNPYFEKLMLDVRKKFNMFPIESKKIVKMMRREPEKLYAFIIDQNLRQGNYYKFLDKDTLITDVPVKLSLKTGKNIIYGYPIRDKKGNFTINSKLIKTEGIESSQENIDKIMNEICEHFSQAIKNDPFQWFGWLHKFWKTTPDNVKGGIYK